MASSSNSDSFVLSKENIQPLKEGRSTAKLGTALHAQHDDAKFKELAKEKEKFETLIRTYKGDDPLQLWCDYVIWVEQSFPTNSQKGNLPILLQKCLTFFKDKSEYFNDIRLIKLWIKYLENTKNTIEMFGIIYSHGIGKKTTLFYRWWAYEYEKEEDFKKADKVYLLGFKNKAEPLDELEFSHKNFQVKVGQLYLGKKSAFTSEPPMPKREVLASLRQHGSAAPVVRLGTDVVKGRAGVIKQNVEDNKPKPRLKIYQDENNPTDQFQLGSQHMSHVPSRDAVVKENTQAPGKWNKKLTSVAQRPRETNPQLNFEVFEEASSASKPSNRMTTNPDVLKAKSGVVYPYDVPIYINEPPDDSKKAMYPKHLVYAGGQEFQLEEVMFLLRKEKEELKQKEEEKKKIESELEIVNEGEIVKMDDSKIEEVNQNRSYEMKHIQENNKQQSKEFEITNDKEEKVEKIESENTKETDPTFESDQTERKKSFTTSSKSPSKASYSLVSKNLHESMTVNTKEVQKLMKNFWSDETSTIIEPTIAKNSSIINDEHKNAILKDKEFEIYINEDVEIKSDYENKKEFEVFTDNESENIHKPKEFTIFSEENIERGKTFEVFESDNDMNDDKQSGYKEKMKILSSENNLDIPSKKEFVIYTEENEIQPKTNFAIYTEDNNEEIQPKTNFAIYTEDNNEEIQPKTNFAIYTEENNEEIKPKTNFAIYTEDNNEEIQPKTNFAIYTEDNNEEIQPKTNFAIYTEDNNEEIQPKTNFAIYTEDNDEEIKSKTKFAIYTEENNEEIKPKTNFAIYTEDNDEEIKAKTNFAIYTNDNNEIKQKREFEIFTEAPKNISFKDKEFELFYNENETSEASIKHIPMEIPYVSSPGMTEEQLLSLGGSERKENLISTSKSKETEKRRSLTGTLQPSKNVQFLPLEDQEKLITSDDKNEEEDFQDDMDDDLPFETTGLTQAFKLPIPASTPNKKGSTKSPETNENSKNSSEKGLRLNTQYISEEIQREENLKRGPEMMNRHYFLSPIMETSKESTSGSSVTVAARYPSQTLAETLPAIPETLNNEESAKKEKSINKSIEVEYKETDKNRKRLFVNLSDEVDPFDENNIEQYLESVEFPSGYTNIHNFQKKMPSIAANKNIELGSQTYKIKGLIGDGGFAKVYKALDSNNQVTTLKVQTPSWGWESYISNEIELRLNNPEAVKQFGLFHSSYIFPNGSILFADFSKFGTLLNIVNKMKVVIGVKQKMELFSFIWAREMILILQHLRKCKIIHADIKPDNFLIQHLSFESNCPPSLKLIDFGRSIDMSLYPEGTSFNKSVKTDCFQCIEMITNKQWTYQIDYFGVAASIHCTLFGEYMKVKQVQDKWNHSSFYPRYYNKPFWTNFFEEMLNVKSCQSFPDLNEILKELESFLEQNLRYYNKFLVIHLLDL